MRLLVIGSLNNEISLACKIAKEKGAKVRQANDIDTALSSLRAGQGADLIMCDTKFDIARLVGSLKNERISIDVVACGYGITSEEAVKAIKDGAKEYIPLPPDEDLIAAVLQAVTAEDYPLLFSSDAMKSVMKVADQIAPSDASVLITGESGTGKEVISHYIHKKSKRAKEPFISINCAAIPDNLLESELFGYEKGAFTGAVSRRVGKFEEANNGTLLLDEISEMDIRLQAKLLRAIQERVIDRVGGSEPVKVNIRILATSNRDLEKEVAKGTFRQDLYFRLNVINLELPPLRDRKDDIRLLSEHFVKHYSDLNAIALRPVSEQAMEKLMAHSWSGNVRELENTIHRAVLLASGSEIGEEAIILSGGAKMSSNDTQGKSGLSPEGALVGRTLGSVERELIIHTLDHCLGNRTHAANILGISIRTLRNKLKQYIDEGYKVPPPAPGEESDEAA